MFLSRERESLARGPYGPPLFDIRTRSRDFDLQKYFSGFPWISVDFHGFQWI